MFPSSLFERYQDRLSYDSGTECWNWTGQKVNWGYGRVTIGRVAYPVHRVFYELFVGPIPDGLQIDHMCRNRVCVNPDHLQAITKSENVALGKLRNTHCPQGHPYSEENTLRSEGHRKCRECNRTRCRQAYYRRKEALTEKEVS